MQLPQTMTIFLEEQEVFSHVGWHKEERVNGISLWVTIRVQFQWQFAADDLNHTVDYAKLLSIVNEESQTECRLLETYAQRMLDRIIKLAEDLKPIIKVTIRKKQLPVADFRGAAAGIELIWESPLA
jgi:dihydroneopterin aldolase